MRDQDEIYEAATEEPATLGCPSLVPGKVVVHDGEGAVATLTDEELHEAATEEPFVASAPSPTLPSGADGTPPADGKAPHYLDFCRLRMHCFGGKGRLFKSKHITSCHGTYIYDYICINDAHIRASLHFDNGGLENHAMLWVGEGERCFCYTTFKTSSAVKCDYLVRGMIAGLAKRLVYHHKNLIKRKAKRAAAKEGGEA